MHLPLQLEISVIFDFHKSLYINFYFCILFVKILVPFFYFCFICWR